MGGPGSGAHLKELDVNALVDMISGGASIKETAEMLDVSPPTIAKRIKQLQEEQGVILQYRTLQSLDLTKLQMKVLNAITDEKIQEAPLKDLVMAFRILKDKEILADGGQNEGEMKGLVGYLIELERREMAGQIDPNTMQADPSTVTAKETHTSFTVTKMIKPIGFDEGEEIPDL
jgi:DNA-binding Lrp family transcriptional regulator